MTRMLDQLGAELARARRRAGDAVRLEPRRHAGDSGGRAVRGAGRSPRADGAGGDVRQARPSSAAAGADRRVAAPRLAAVLSLRATTPSASSNFAFYEDSLRYDAFNAAVRQPTLIFQGLHDASVDYRTVEAFATAAAERHALAARRRPSADREPAADVDDIARVPRARRMKRARASGSRSRRSRFEAQGSAVRRFGRFGNAEPRTWNRRTSNRASCASAF